ncbi:MAG TPA: DUF5683 domain-containing protein [Anaerolineae bacterium]|nr:DUF5683 domain-containing protein [Anaerolineae bacterium]
MRNPSTAAILSFIAPGFGQIYNGTYWWALFWLIITPGFWISTAGILAIPFHFIASYTAYRYAQRHLYHTPVKQ